MKRCKLAPPLAALAILAGCAAGASGDAAQTTGASGLSAAVEITMKDGTFDTSAAGVTVADNVATITAGGTYALSGKLEDGQLVIDAEDQKVELVLNGADLTSKTGAPLYAKGGKVTLTLAEGTGNTLTDAPEYQGGEDEPTGAVFSKDDLTIGGTGTLTVNGRFQYGIVGKDDLTIEGGNINVTAKTDAIRGKDSVTVNGGTLTVDAGEDGIKSNNDQDADKGSVTLNGGVFNITAGSDAIQAETALSVTGGEYILTAGGGSGEGRYQGEASCKGLKAGGNLSVAGGNFTLDTLDDAVHANGAVDITGGSFTIAAGDDGIHADGALTISGGDITITKSYEGLEGKSVTVADGVIRVTASDDGVNAADPTAQEGPGFGGGREGGMTPPEGMTPREGGAAREDMTPPAGAEQTAPEGGPASLDAGPPEMNRPRDETASAARPQREGMGGRTVDETIFIRVSGGTLAVDAGGDGLDSNGVMYLEGGTVLINGPTNSGNGALDSEGGCIVNGGVLAAAGSAGMAQSPSEDSAQASLTVYFNETQPAGTAVSLYQGDGTHIVTFVPAKQFQSVVFSAPELKEGETVTVSTGGAGEADADGYAASWSGGTELTSATLEKATRITQDGSAYSGGMGMGRMGGGMRNNKNKTGAPV